MIRALPAALLLAGCAANSPPPIPRTLPPNFPPTIPIVCSAFFETEADLVKNMGRNDGGRARDARRNTAIAAAFYHIAESVFGRGAELAGLHARFLSDLRQDIAEETFDVNGERDKMLRDCEAFGVTQPETRPLFTDD